MGTLYTLKKVLYAPSESRETAHIAGLCWPNACTLRTLGLVRIGAENSGRYQVPRSTDLRWILGEIPPGDPKKTLEQLQLRNPPSGLDWNLFWHFPESPRRVARSPARTCSRVFFGCRTDFTYVPRRELCPGMPPRLSTFSLLLHIGNTL